MSQMRESPILRRRMNHLPCDIVLNILGKLPVKSVIRLWRVCKFWDSLITTPSFISTHLNRNNNNNKDNGNDYIIHMASWKARRLVSSHLSKSTPKTSICTVAFDRTFDKISDIEIPFDFTSDCTQMVGSCNGLLCLADSNNVIYLWNPSVRKFKKLPHTCLENLNHVTLGFAYCSENNDYKVVRTSRSTFLSPSEIEMYTLSSDSWRRVEISVTTDVWFSKDLLSPSPLVSGALHWITETSIVAFDVNSEKFRRLALPDVSIYGQQLQRTCIASLRGKLAFIAKLAFIGQSSFQYFIWVMTDYGVVESWNKLFVVPFERLACWVRLTDYGSLMVGYRDDPFGRQGLKYALIDTETLQEKKDPDIQHPSFIASFMESLVLLDGTNVESY
ncbi:hypothetical protein ACB092_11G133900 [Castanea dentata]